MNPYYFGSSGRRLFGCYHPPVGGGGLFGVVICNPLGAEYFPAHKTVRLLARHLAEHGIHVLRFDYFGTGDSDGSEADATIDSCVRDVCEALEELRDVGDTTRAGLIGIRAGAIVAVHAAAMHKGIARLVLWDPLTEGGVAVTPSSNSDSMSDTLLVSTRSESADVSLVKTLTEWSSAPPVVHAPAAPFWSDRAPGSGGLPIGAIEETAKWLSN